MLATSSISGAIQYYKEIRSRNSGLKMLNENADEVTIHKRYCLLIYFDVYHYFLLAKAG